MYMYVLRGRMQFAKAQLWARCAKLCLNAVTSHTYGSSGDRLSDHGMTCLSMFRDSLVSSRPREITARWSTPYFLFKDACFCPEDLSWPCGLGGMLVDPHGNQVSAMSICLEFHELEILEAKLLALLICLVLWRKYLKNRPCVAFIDNNATRHVRISGSAKTFPHIGLVAQLLEAEDRGNPHGVLQSAGPSRGSCVDLKVKPLPNELVAIVLKKCFGKLKQASVNMGWCGPAFAHLVRYRTWHDAEFFWYVRNSTWPWDDGLQPEPLSVPIVAVENEWLVRQWLTHLLSAFI